MLPQNVVGSSSPFHSNQQSLTETNPHKILKKFQSIKAGLHIQISPPYFILSRSQWELPQTLLTLSICKYIYIYIKKENILYIYIPWNLKKQHHPWKHGCFWKTTPNPLRVPKCSTNFMGVFFHWLPFQKKKATLFERKTGPNAPLFQHAPVESAQLKRSPRKTRAQEDLGSFGGSRGFTFEVKAPRSSTTLRRSKPRSFLTKIIDPSKKGLGLWFKNTCWLMLVSF